MHDLKFHEQFAYHYRVDSSRRILTPQESVLHPQYVIFLVLFFSGAIVPQNTNISGDLLLPNSKFEIIPKTHRAFCNYFCNPWSQKLLLFLFCKSTFPSLLKDYSFQLFRFLILCLVSKPKNELFVIHQIEGVVLLLSFFSLNDIEIGRS